MFGLFPTLAEFTIARTNATAITTDKAGVILYPDLSTGSFKVAIENNQPR